MNANKLNQDTVTSAALLAGRILLATIFLVSGFGKLAQAQGTIGYIASVGLPAPTLAYAGAVITELGGGLLLIFGFQTRVVAAILAGFSLVSAVLFHNGLGDQNQLFHFLKNIAMAGGLLQVVAVGAGRFSVDAARKVGAGLTSFSRVAAR